MHFFSSFSAAIADRRPFSASAQAAAACRDRSDRGAQFCAATDFNLRISCFGLLLHWEWYLESTWVGVDKGCEDLAADCAGALRPGAASHLGETPFLEGFLQVGMLIRGLGVDSYLIAMDGYGTAGDGRRLLRKGQF